MQKELITRLHKNFEECAHENSGVEFWYARELQELLGYDEWRNFEQVIQRAKIACENAKQTVSDHFVDVNKTIPMPKGASKDILDIMLTRYACYLIAQNGDPRKDEIAFAMTYFAVQTRKQEVIEERLAQWERVRAREKLTYIFLLSFPSSICHSRESGNPVEGKLQRESSNPLWLLSVRTTSTS